MSRYLVTGGCGFIGSNLVKSLLSKGHEVIVLDDLSTGRADSIPAHIPLIKADVADASAVLGAFNQNVDGCFHLAANPSVSQSIEDYAGCHRTNLGGTVAVFDSASKHALKRGTHVPVVYASSCAVYGDAEIMPLSEDADTNPLSSYGTDKLCGEIHARMASSAYNLPSVGLRFFNVFGPGQRPESVYSGVLSIFCKTLAEGNQVTIYGDGLQERDFVFVDDVVGALCLAMRQAVDCSPGIFNVCTGVRRPLIDVGHLIADFCSTSFEPEFASARTGDIRMSLGNPAKCFESIGWKYSTDFEDGIRQTLNWLATQESAMAS